MKKRFAGFGKIFRFTFRQQTSSKRWRATTVGLLATFVLLPAIIMSAVELASGGEEYVYSGAIDSVVVAGADAKELSVLSQAGDPRFVSLQYVQADSLENAAALADRDDVILWVEQAGGSETLRVLLPDETDLTYDDADAYSDFVLTSYPLVLLERSGLTPEQLGAVMQPIHTETEAGAPADDAVETVRFVLSMVLPYLVVMILYFMVLAYGQSVANCVIAEKSSKLMDTFLLAVRPAAMIMGKVLAIAAAAALQLMLWVAGIVGGFALGSVLVRTINPASDMGILLFFDALGTVAGLFTAEGIILAIIMILAGFLLYCALAAVGGALASKAEDLANTNMLFSMALVISFLATLMGGAAEGALTASSLQAYVPFCSVLAAPGLMMLGEMSLAQGLLSLGLSLAATVLVILLAGAVYRRTVFHKGDPISLPKMIAMLKKK